MKRGFTLIELLAVIVILAIIAIIATPIVLNIIKDAKESANIRSVENYMDAIENTIISSNFGSFGQIPDGVYDISEEGNLCIGKFSNMEDSNIYKQSYAEGLSTCDLTNKTIMNIEVSGEKPTKGVIWILNGSVRPGSVLKVNNNQYVYDGKEYLKAVDLDNFETHFAEGTSGLNIIKKSSNYSNKIKKLVIPAYDSGGNKITQIDINGFSGLSVTHLVIPASIGVIGNSAFINCNNLMLSVIPITAYVGDNVFARSATSSDLKIINGSLQKNISNWETIIGNTTVARGGCLLNDNTITCNVIDSTKKITIITN